MTVVDELEHEHDTPAPDGTAEWNDVLGAYATTLESQRAYLDAVSSGASDVEPPNPFSVPTGLPPLPDDVRQVIATLHAATLSLLAQHADLPSRLEPPRVGVSIARRTTTTTVSVLDRAL